MPDYTQTTFICLIAECANYVASAIFDERKKSYREDGKAMKEHELKNFIVSHIVIGSVMSAFAYVTNISAIHLSLNLPLLPFRI